MKIPVDILEEVLDWDIITVKKYLVELLGDIFHLKEKNIHEYHKIKKKKLGIK